MPRTVITGDELSILYFALAQFSGTDELPNKERFQMGVEIATRIIKAVLESPQTEAEISASYYIDLYDRGANLSNFVEDLINNSEQKSTKAEPHDQKLAYDMVLRIASLILRGPRIIPENLRFFLADVIDDIYLDKTKKMRPRPTSRGPNKDTNFTRNKALRVAYLQMCTFGFNKFRSKSSGNKFRSKSSGNNRNFLCSYKGGSSMDVVGVAYEDISGTMLAYKSIEEIVRQYY